PVVHRPRRRPGQAERERRRDRGRPPVRHDRRAYYHHAAEQPAVPRRDAGPGDHVRGRRPGHGDDLRAAQLNICLLTFQASGGCQAASYEALSAQEELPRRCQLSLTHSPNLHSSLIARIPVVTGRDLAEWFHRLEAGPAFFRREERAHWLAGDARISCGYAPPIVHEYEKRRRLRLNGA